MDGEGLIYSFNVKVNFVLEQDMKAQRGKIEV
jgi:hypothetical protein